MALKKSALAVAVTVALSSHAFAAGPGGDADLGFQGSIGKITVGTKTQALSSLNTKRCTGECDEYAPDHDYISVNELRKNDPTSAIKIHDAELKFLDFDLNSYELPNFSSTDSGGTLALENVKAELAIIETNGSTISNTGAGAAIEIKDTTLTGGDIILEAGDTVPEIFKGHKELLTNNGGAIFSENNDAINISNSEIDGLIINEGDYNISGTIGSSKGAAISVNNTKWRGGIANSESYILGDRAGIELVDTQLEGAILNDRDSVIGGTYGIISYRRGGDNSSFTGVINNEGLITGYIGGIKLDDTEFNGVINNSGSIAADINGIYIGDDVTGNVVINQTAGELIGETALRMNKITRTNFTGGDIIGNVSNHGGAFYVEGNQTIAGDYMQTAGSTLAMGLHKETSLTANNISLDKESTVLIDLSKGDMYIRNGDSVELLKVTADGKITDEADYAIASKLVSIADIKKEDDKVTLTFKRDKFVDSSNASSQRQADNFNNLGAALANISKNLPSDTPVETIRYFNALLAVIEENPEAALPDVSGASKAAAMSATNQSNTQVSVRARGLASGDALENTGLWVQGIVSKGQQDDRNNEAYDVKSHGFVLGADTELGNGAVAGAAYSFIKNEINTQNSRTESDYHMATLYGAQAMDQVLLDGQVYYAWGSNDSSRDIGANASYDSNLYGARVGAGYQFDLDNAARFIPTLSLEASRLSVDGYTESGFGALKMDKQHFNRLELGLSTELSKDYQLSKAMVTPSITLGAFHDFKADTQNSTVAFAVAPAETFNVEGNKPEKTRYVAGAGVDIVNNGNLTVSAEYNYNWNTDGFDANSGALKFRWDF